MKARFARMIGLRMYGSVSHDSSTCSHRHEFEIRDEVGNMSDKPERDDDIFNIDMDRTYKCDVCGNEFNPTHRGTGFRRLYDTPSGKIEPGCLYWNDWYPNDQDWDNMSGPHIEAMLPDGSYWVLTSRASNCGSKQDRTHRCWCVHGNPEQPSTMHVDKVGHTCSAGAGSIQTSTWHGFLHHGEWRKC